MSRYKIKPQPVKGGEVDIKRIKFRPQHNKAEPLAKPTFKPIKFPMLKVNLDRAGLKGHLEVAWSNYKGQFGLNPGKFKFRYVVEEYVIVHLKNANGQVAKHNGKPIIDYATMTKNYGTTLEAGSLVFGESHPKQRNVKWEKESETLQGCFSQIREKLGEALATKVMALFTGHELFQAFFATQLRKAA